jgi:hypothetical protein
MKFPRRFRPVRGPEQISELEIIVDRFNISEEGHVAVILPPQSITGGTGLINPAFTMKGYKHATIIIASGAEATQDTSTITLSLCSTAAGANPIAIPFNYYFQALGGAGNDVLSTIQNATAAGITLAAGDWPPNGLIVIEIDANELAAATGPPLGGSLGINSYIGVTIGSPAAVDMCCVMVVLSGPRFDNVPTPTVTQ